MRFIDIIMMRGWLPLREPRNRWVWSRKDLSPKIKGYVSVTSVTGTDAKRGRQKKIDELQAFVFIHHQGPRTHMRIPALGNGNWMRRTPMNSVAVIDQRLRIHATKSPFAKIREVGSTNFDARSL